MATTRAAKKRRTTSAAATVAPRTPSLVGRLSSDVLVRWDLRALLRFARLDRQCSRARALD